MVCVLPNMDLCVCDLAICDICSEGPESFIH